MDCGKLRPKSSIFGGVCLCAVVARSVRSNLSASETVCLAGFGSGEVKSRHSVSGGAETVFLRRGERRGRVELVTSLRLAVVLEMEVEEDLDIVEALDDIEVSGGRIVGGCVTRRGFIGGRS